MKPPIKWLAVLVAAVVGGVLYARLVKNLYHGAQTKLDAQNLVEGYSDAAAGVPRNALKDFVHDTNNEWYSEEDPTTLSEEEVRQKSWTQELEIKKSGHSTREWVIEQDSGSKYKASLALPPRLLAFNIDLDAKQSYPLGGDAQELAEFLGDNTAAGPKAPEVLSLHQAAINFIKARSKYILDCALKIPAQKVYVADAKTKFQQAAKAYLAKHSKRDLDNDAVAHRYRHLLVYVGLSPTQGG